MKIGASHIYSQVNDLLTITPQLPAKYYRGARFHMVLFISVNRHCSLIVISYFIMREAEDAVNALTDIGLHQEDKRQVARWCRDQDAARHFSSRGLIHQ